MRFLHQPLLFMIAVFLAGYCHLAAAQTLQVGVAEWPPYQMYDGDGVKGVVIDLLREVSVRTGYVINYQKVPQKRMLQNFREQTITIEPASNPSWREDDRDISLYSIPYMQAKNVVLMKKGSGIQASSPKDFHGKVLGCDLGYIYTDGFEEEFGNGTIKRDDVPSGARSNLHRLAINRVDGIIVDPVVARYWMKELRLNQADFEEVYTLKGDNSLFVRLHVSQGALLPTVNKALEEIVGEGVIQKLVERYTGN